MQPDVFLRLVFGQPSKTDTITIVSLPKMLVRPLDRRDHATLRRDGARLAHHITFVRTIAVDGDQQRGFARAIRYIEVVVKIDLSPQRKIGFLHSLSEIDSRC